MSLVPIGELQAVIKAAREAAFAAIGKNVQASLRVDPLALLTLMDMLEGGDGFTRLVRDDAIDRLSAEVDRLHEQIMLLVACRDDGRAK